MSESEQKTFTEAEQAVRMEKLKELWQAVEDDKPHWVIARAYECDHKMPNVDGRTALMYAAFLGRSECVGKLAYHMLDPDVAAHDHGGRTALHWAAVSGDFSHIGRLVLSSSRGDYESFILRKDADGKTPFDIALEMGRFAFVNRLFDAIFDHRKEAVAKKCVMPHFKERPFGVISAMAAHLELRDIVAKHVASLGKEERDWRGRSALHFAAMAGAHGAVKKMLAMGHNPRALDNSGATPLMACAQVELQTATDKAPWIETAKLLIPVTDVLWADSHGRTALMHAAHVTNLELIKVLLPSSDANAMDNKRLTALQIEGRREVDRSGISDLLAPVTMRHESVRLSSNRDILGRSLRKLAQEGDVGKLTKMLHDEKKRSQRDQDSPLDRFHRDSDRLPLVFRQDKWGTTALMVAARHGQTACVEALLEHGADAMDRDFSGKTALMGAVVNGSLDCVRVLIPRSHVDAKTELGTTALQLAHDKGFKAIFELLSEVARVDVLDSKSDPQYTNKGIY